MKAVGTLRAREFFAIVIFSIGTKLSDTTPAIYAQTGKNAFWLMPLVSFLVMVPSILVLLYLLKKHQDKNIIGLTRHILGNKMGTFCSLLFFLMTFFALSIDSRNYVETLSTMYFEESPTLSLYLVFMIVCAFGAKRGFETIGSVSWAFMPYIKASIVLLGFIALQDVVWQRIFPIFGEGFKDLVFEGVKKGSIFGDLMLLTIAYPVLKDKKSFHKGFLFGGAFAFVELTLFFLLYCIFFDYQSIAKVAFPFHEVTQYVNLGTFFTNIETFFMTFWVLAAFLRFIIYLYVGAWLFGETFRIKEFEPLVFILAFLTITLGMVFEGPIYNTMLIRSKFLDLLTPLFIAFPIILLMVDYFKGEMKKNETY